MPSLAARAGGPPSLLRASYAAKSAGGIAELIFANEPPRYAGDRDLHLKRLKGADRTVGASERPIEGAHLSGLINPP